MNQHEHWDYKLPSDTVTNKTTNTPQNQHKNSRLPEAIQQPAILHLLSYRAKMFCLEFRTVPHIHKVKS